MSALTINVDISHAAATLARTNTALNSSDLHEVAAASVSKLLRQHFITRNARSSTSNYWSHAGESVRHVSDIASGTVIVGKEGVGWHRYGGTIRAKPGKALAIPLRAALKGVWPSEKFTQKNDAFIWRRKGKVFLASKEGKALRIHYILLKSVSKRADPTILPTDASISEAAATAITQLIQLAIQRSTALRTPS